MGLNFFIFEKNSVMAQVIPDRSVGTVVHGLGTSLTIDGGTRSGNNLFHSFNQFSIPTSQTVFFNNANDIQNIFSRVTGGVPSNLNGIIKTNGTSNFFLLNPSGILIGPNAALNIGGSFLGTTASSLQFNDGLAFNTTDQPAHPLLSIAVPIGLQFNGSSGQIQGVGNGSQLPNIRSFVPVSGTSNLPGFRVPAGQTLALIGGPVSLSGSILIAPQGRIELGAVETGTVKLIPSTTPSIKGWTIDYQNVNKFHPIALSQAALVDVSGLQAGSVQFQSSQFKLNTGSVVLSQNLGRQTSGSLRVSATEGIYLSGESSKGQASTFITEALGPGRGGEIEFTTPHLQLDSGATIALRNFGTGRSGNALLTAQNISIKGVSRLNPILRSSIYTVTYGLGKGGDMLTTAKTIEIGGGAFLATSTFGPGLGGSLQVNASDHITVKGYEPILTSPSTIGTATYSSGNSGDIQISTPRLNMLGGGRIDASTFASGHAGNINIQAQDSIWVQGGVVAINNPSLISSSATILSPSLRQILRLPALPTGNSANVNIETGKLFISDEALVNVRNDGLGQAGKVMIKANQVQLDRLGAITAATRSGKGGEIEITADALILRHQSSIVATAGGLGNGGNITLNAGSIVGLENSDIIANAIQGRGGNIKITTQALLGLAFRKQLTPNNDITASSEFGINGNVQVNTIELDPSSALNTLPTDVIDSSRQMSDRCNSLQQSSFIATGRGGVSTSQNQMMSLSRPWHDLRSMTVSSAEIPTNLTEIQSVLSSSAQPLIEADTVQIDESGAIVLTTQQSLISFHSPATCASRMQD